jgi:hypothetical protein
MTPSRRCSDSSSNSTSSRSRARTSRSCLTPSAGAAVPSVTHHRTAMIALNSARVGYKHHGNVLDAMSIERHRASAQNFLTDLAGRARAADRGAACAAGAGRRLPAADGPGRTPARARHPPTGRPEDTALAANDPSAGHDRGPPGRAHRRVPAAARWVAVLQHLGPSVRPQPLRQQGVRGGRRPARRTEGYDVPGGHHDARPTPSLRERFAAGESVVAVVERLGHEDATMVLRPDAARGVRSTDHR